MNPTNGLETITETGKAPETRVKSVEDARSIAMSIIDGSKDRDRLNARIKGMLDGNPPYDPAKLRQAGQADRTNVNFLEGKGALSAALVPYYDLFAGSKYYAAVRTSRGSPEERKEWSQIITEEFDETLKGYSGFDFNMQRCLHDFVGFGKGFLMWRDDRDWRFRCIKHHRLKVPDGTPASVDDLEVFLVIDEEKVSDLWNSIKDENASQQAGWNREAALKAIRGAMPENEVQNDDYMEIQRKIRDKELTYGLKCSKVWVAHLYVLEFDRTVTHLTFCLYQPPKNNEGKEEFLFMKKGRFKTMRHCLSAFFFEVLDGSWNGASGLGRDIFAPMELKNRLRCSVVDNAFLRSGITLQPKTPNALNKSSLIHVGKLNIIPPDYDVVQGHVFADISGAMAADREMDMMLQSNTGVYRQRMDKPTGNPRTAEEVRLQYQSSAVLGNSAVTRFYQQLDWLYQEIYRRISQEQIGDDEGSNAAREFQKRCLDRGVPIEAVRNPQSVRSFHSLGNGSVMMKRDAIDGMAKLYALLPEKGQKAFTEDAIAVYTNQDMVERYFPSGEADTPSDHEATATLENAAMKIGSPVLRTDTQDDLIHARVHLTAAAQALAALPQGANEDEVRAFLEMIGPHASIHVEKLAGSDVRKAEYKALNAILGRVGIAADKLAERAEARRQDQILRMQQEEEARAISEGMDPETQIQLAKTKNDMVVKNAKAAQLLRHKQEKHNLSMKMTEEKSAK